MSDLKEAAEAARDEAAAARNEAAGIRDDMAELLNDQDLEPMTILDVCTIWNQY